MIKSIERSIVVNAGKTTSQGVLITLEEKLINEPISNWDKILKNYTGNAVYIIPTHKLHLTQAENNKLNKGELIFKSGKTYQFLNLVLVEHTAYKKVGNTDYVLSYQFSNPNQIINDYINPAVTLILKYFSSKPKNQWNVEASTLEKIYGFQLQIYDTNNPNLPSEIVNALSTKPLVFSTTQHTSNIDKIYYAFNQGILEIGPINHLAISGRITDVMYYFILIFFILTFGIILFLTFLFVKNMRKIYQTTENFSHGKFNLREKIPSTSVLYGMHSNINAMGDKLQQLIESKKNMSRFVAHEIRTPLYTMDLALNALIQVEKLPKETDDYVVSLKEDIQQLNELVSLFLLYSQSSEQELKINKRYLNLKDWLNTLMARHQISNKNIQLSLEDSDDISVHFDPKLLKHAIENILVNAVKFAKSKVVVSLFSHQENTIITIDDDGHGVDPEDWEKIFDAFFTSTHSEVFGGHIGLGLSIAKSIVELHSGKVFIDNSPVGGCRFIIELPNKSI